MTYVFDTSAFRELQHFYPAVFTSVWPRLDEMVERGLIVSTKEVLNELEQQNVSSAILEWCRSRVRMFQVPTTDELNFVREIFRVRRFQDLLSKKAILLGRPVADPFVIAKARVITGTVVSQERLKPNAVRIPNVCEYFGIPCTDLEGFMFAQGWRF